MERFQDNNYYSLSQQAQFTAWMEMRGRTVGSEGDNGMGVNSRLRPVDRDYMARVYGPDWDQGPLAPEMGLTSLPQPLLWEEIAAARGVEW